MWKWLFGFCLLSQAAAAQELEKSTWHDYAGTVGEIPVRLLLHLSSDSIVTAHYCYEKYCTRIPLSGTVAPSGIVLRETGNGKTKALFRLQLVKGDSLTGSWTDATAQRHLIVRLHLVSAIVGVSNKLHYGQESDDSVVDAFMQRVRTALLKRDAAWLATQVRYPVRVFLNGRRVATIRSRSAFLAHAPAILHKAYLQRIRNTCLCTLFSNYQGVMLGNGEVWIRDVYPGKPSLRIVALNNGLIE
ncbi:hypothetical protein [Flaviaesturariibacter aridisoli]|uniref:Uncharacterized protein n=1 Tax=Flaviaesturariibacter aridisoli TaxID=2545761 RepID=A0A4V2WMK4_9BACT|nr:hypothetical protein [Flaviaesturariibacter aridisoli]TCZ69101.1 hypothetical protein E0486_13070 [Flaviaesturariibacter aridisoli]